MYLPDFAGIGYHHQPARLLDHNFQCHRIELTNAELFEARNLADQALHFKAGFAAKVSHELRTSLNLILGFSETMAFAQESYGKKLPPPYLRDVTEIYRNSRHLLALIDDILDLSKLAEVLRESLEMVRPLIETKGLVLLDEISLHLPGINLTGCGLAKCC